MWLMHNLRREACQLVILWDMRKGVDQYVILVKYQKRGISVLEIVRYEEGWRSVPEFCQISEKRYVSACVILWDIREMVIQNEIFVRYQKGEYIVRHVFKVRYHERDILKRNLCAGGSPVHVYLGCQEEFFGSIIFLLFIKCHFLNVIVCFSSLCFDKGSNCFSISILCVWFISCLPNCMVNYLLTYYFKLFTVKKRSAAINVECSPWYWP